ncbi:PHP domain-containing protein ['Camptotheca acuminata' phytoplasma]|uniref:PHP domain-containing protein n=1 Tax='Camptotheca acuminata' phytoplasma TaxID=3239192 RepID=UPI00351A2ECE
MTGVFYVQSYYSLMESIPDLESLVKKAKENEYDFIALSDDQNLYGMQEFLFICRKYKIKPILGTKVYLSLNNLLSKEKRIGLLVYATNDLGVRHLIQISNLVKTEQKDISLEELEKLQEGLFFILPNIEFVFFKMMEGKLIEKILLKLKETLTLFFFGLSLQSGYLELFVYIFLDIIKELKIKIVPVHKTNFLEPEQEEAHDLLLKLFHVEQEETHSSLDFLEKEEKEVSFLFLSSQEIKDKYSSYSEEYEFLNLNEFISKIEYINIFPPGLYLPQFKQTSESDSFQYLKKLTSDFLKKNFSSSDSQFVLYQKRLDEELKVIRDMHFEDYFLIVADLVNFAKKEEIFVGPGRGSSSGSLVCFCLGITEVDPIFYNLLFERFLNSKRNKKPDIDLDFPDDKIYLILEYIFKKYGSEYTSNIITFSTLTQKSFEKNSNYLNYQKKFPFLKYQEHKQKQIISQLEGMPQFTRNHPAGIIISNKNLLQFIPLEKNTNSNSPFLYQTQLEAKYLEKIGLVKIDLLSLKSLTLIDKILKEINKKRKEKIFWDQFSLDDKETYQLLQDGQTEYIFQLESVSAKKVLRTIKPSNFQDFIAVLALNRPGQIHYINNYHYNKTKKRNFLMDEEIYQSIGHILENTNGLILYQEQIMEIVVHVLGCDFGEAEIFMRYMISKKNSNLEEDRNKKNFLELSQRNGNSLRLSLKIYDYILKFSDYSFNKSHSVAYSLISYRMAFLKTHYLIFFLKVILEESQKNPTETNKILTQIQKQKSIKIFLPDILASDLEYQLTDEGTIGLPFTLIKSVSPVTASFIIKERKKRIFSDVYDFINRCRTVLNNNVLKDLFLSGICDNFDFNKNDLLNEVDLFEYFEHRRYLPQNTKVINKELSPEILQKEISRIFGFNLTYFIF